MLTVPNIGHTLLPLYLLFILSLLCSLSGYIMLG